MKPRKIKDLDVDNAVLWCHDNCYTITFDANGGNLGHSVETVKQYKSKKGESFFTLISAWNDDPHKIFEGWYLDKEKTQLFELDYYGNFVPQSDMTIYAGWKECVAVSFDMNGGYYYNANLDKETDLYVSKTEVGTTLSDIPFPRNNDVVKEFEGWYWDKECKKAVENMNTVKFDKDVTVYAKWKVVYLKLTADACGGYFICDGNEIKEKREIGIEPGSGPWQLLSYRPMNADKHKVFDEWYLDKEYTQRWDMSYEFTKDTTVYAKWNDVFVVTFDANGGYFYDPNEKPILTMQMSIEPNKMPYCTQTPQIEDSHKTFDGWYLDKECTVKASEYLVNSDVTLYAKWYKLIKVTFDANGGCFYNNEKRTEITSLFPKNQLISENSETSGTLSENKTFAGWYFDKECTKPDAFQKIFVQLYKLAASSDYIRDMRINESLSALLTLLMQESWNPDHVAVSKKRMELAAVKAYMDEHYTQKLTLDDLESQFFINKYYLLKIFKETYGMTISSYLISKRITRAKQLLRFTQMTIDEVGCAVGMDGAGYFSRMFKKAEGISPKEYRKQWQQH